jgi:S-methyl-1-thioxylulose 5-phosphate methylthiotransferase
MGVVRRRVDDGPGWRWDGVEPRAYANGAERHLLVGTGEGARQVELRYFEIPAGGASALERHPHEHAVLILHGSGSVLLGETIQPVGPGDAVFVESDEQHQFRAAPGGPLGFACAVLALR